jgi:tetratricopeptide (TPR) repeat protein
MTANDFSSTTQRQTLGLSRKRRGQPYLRRAARLRAAALCALLGVSLMAAGNPEQFWGIVGALLPGVWPATATLAAPVQIRIADSEYAKGHYEEAARRYTALIAQHPTHPLAEHASLSRIETHVALGDLESAQIELESFRMRAPRHPALPKLLLDVAALHFQVGQYDRAARDYTDVIALVTRFEGIEAIEDSEPPTPSRRRQWTRKRARSQPTSVSCVDFRVTRAAPRRTTVPAFWSSARAG